MYVNSDTSPSSLLNDIAQKRYYGFRAYPNLHIALDCIAFLVTSRLNITQCLLDFRIACHHDCSIAKTTIVYQLDKERLFVTSV